MKRFLRDVFSSSDSASWSRLGSFMALLGVLFCMIWITVKTASMKEIPFVSMSGFVTSLYLIGKGYDMVKAKIDASKASDDK